MTGVMQIACQRVPAVVTFVYETRMRWLHRGAPFRFDAEWGHEGAALEAFAGQHRAWSDDVVAHCRRKPRFPSGPDGRHWRCSWCGRTATAAPERP